jgi:hypothetical protein
MRSLKGVKQMNLYRKILLLTTMPRAYEGAVQAFYTDETAIPEGLKGHYKEVEANGTKRWELQVEITGIDGVKTFTDYERLNGALRKERNDHKGAKDVVKKVLNGRSVEDVLADLDEIPVLREQAEAAGDTKKIDQLVETKLKARLAPVERERDTFKTKVNELEGIVANNEVEKKTRSVRDVLRTAAVTAKVIPEALDDVILVGERYFDLDEAGKVVAKDVPGITVGIDPSIWLTDMQQKRAYWFGTSGGGGAGGNRGGGITGTNPWTLKDWNLTAQGQMLKENREKAEQMAKVAGVPLTGGIRPQK